MWYWVRTSGRYPHAVPHAFARPKDPPTAPRLKYACVAYEFSDFGTAHSLRRHLCRVHNLGCDTFVKGYPFPHTGYVMRRATAREREDFPRITFPDDWAVSHRADIDPGAVSDHPPFVTFSRGSGLTYCGCVLIRNDDRGVVVSGGGRGKTCLLLQIGLDAEARRTRNEATALAAEKTELAEQLESTAEQLESTKKKWGADEAVTPTPSTEHRERITCKAAPSRVLLRPT